MVGSLRKYFDIRSDQAGNILHWPGTADGYPFRGPEVPVTTQGEYEQLPIVYDAKSKLLIIPDDLDEYNNIIDKCANGWFVLRHEKFLNNEATGTIRVFLSWLEIYGEKPSEKSAFKDERQLSPR